MDNNKQSTHCHVAMATVDDISTIAQFQIEMAMESEGYKLSPDKITQGVTAAMNDANKGAYIIAKIDGKAVGSLMITREWSDWNNCWYWWVQSVYVMPQYRGKGIYKAMYAHVKDMAREHGVSQVRLYVDKGNTRAQEVYKKLGMDECHYLMYEVVI
ncbi:MAG: GNAT family N-acetyltransferase [Muribaculaceae bacterium]|nr:GNAT family N-acetyltransferase [Muribaculaceae bacterium]